MKTLTNRFLLVIALIAPFVFHGKAASEISFVAPILTPYAYYDEEGQLTGTQVELVNKINQTSKIKLDVFPVPASRLMRTISSGKADLAILIESDAANALGEKIALITQPSFMIVSLKGAKVVSSFAELKGQSVGYISSAFYGEEFDKNTDIYKVPLLDNVKALNMLLLKRIDYLATSERGLVYLLNEKKVFGKVVPQFVFHQTNAYLYLSKRSKSYAELIKQLPPLLQEMDRQGVLAKIINQWTFDDTSIVAKGDNPVVN